MPFGFGRKEQPRSFITDLTDKEDFEEFKEIADMLNPNEDVFVVTRESRLRPDGSAFTPNIVFGYSRHYEEYTKRGRSLAHNTSILQKPLFLNFLNQHYHAEEIIEEPVKEAN
jgi:hypothetical protein